MKEKIGRNSICDCGSGRKYKHCCLRKDQDRIRNESTRPKAVSGSFLERLSKLPFTAQITSTDGAAASMKVYSASVVKNGVEEILFNDELELSTNLISEKTTDFAVAFISVPQSRIEKSTFATEGNATVSNAKSMHDIVIYGNKKKLKTKSPSGLFAKIQISFRRDVKMNCFDIYFGKSGQHEHLDNTGKKERPHLTIFPDGNAKYLRFNPYRCKIVSNQEYYPDMKIHTPTITRISIEGFAEELVLTFSFDTTLNILQLDKADFISGSSID